MTEAGRPGYQPHVAAIGPRMLRALGRVTSSGTFIPLIDGLRFVAIAAVVLYHLNDFLVHKMGWESSADVRGLLVFRLLNVGSSGVQLFFALSGFILGLPFAEKLSTGQPLRLRHYYLRRLTRLEPPYVINLLIATALLALVSGESLPELLSPLAASLGYVHNVVYGELSRINGVAWSLEVEVQFYLLAPLLAWTIYRRPVATRRAVLVCAIAAAIALKYYSADALGPRLSLSLLNYLEYFLVGMLLADVYLSDWKSAPDKSWRYDVAGSAAWLAVPGVQLQGSTAPLLPLACFAAYYCSFRGVWLSWLLTRRALVVIGGMCYTIYLYHFYVISAVGNPALQMVGQRAYPLMLTALMVVVLPAVLVVAAAMFLLFEKPFMVWRPFADRGLDHQRRSTALGIQPDSPAAVRR